MTRAKPNPYATPDGSEQSYAELLAENMGIKIKPIRTRLDVYVTMSRAFDKASKEGKINEEIKKRYKKIAGLGERQADAQGTGGEGGNAD